MDEPIFCMGCKHLKTYCPMGLPAVMYKYCDLEKCELENKEDNTDGTKD